MGPARKVDPASLTFQQQTSYETMLRMVWTPNGPALPETIQAQPQQPAIQGPRVLRLGPKGFVSK
jgi:hypothetical protein